MPRGVSVWKGQRKGSGKGEGLGAGCGNVGRVRELLLYTVVKQEQIEYALNSEHCRGRLNQDTMGWQGNICSQCG